MLRYVRATGHILCLASNDVRFFTKAALDLKIIRVSDFAERSIT